MVCDLQNTEVELGKYKAYVMDGQNPRQVMLGYDTDCCQHLGSAGETAMMYGLANPDAGFWVIEDKESGKILAQAKCWETETKDVDISKLVSEISGWYRYYGCYNSSLTPEEKSSNVKCAISKTLKEHLGDNMSHNILSSKGYDSIIIRNAPVGMYNEPITIIKHEVIVFPEHFDEIRFTDKDTGLYHYTTNDFDKFDVNMSSTGHGSSYGLGAYFTDTPIPQYGNKKNVEYELKKPYIFDILDTKQVVDFLCTAIDEKYNSEIKGIKLYHSSNSLFSEFSNDKINKYPGFWFTEDKEYAQDHGKYTYEVDVTFNNPINIDTETGQDILEKHFGGYSYGDDDIFSQEFREFMKQEGYDALIWEHHGSKTYVVLDEKQTTIIPNRKDTLIFDNIEFADDLQIDHFAPIIAKWCEASPYQNILVGNGRNEMVNGEIRRADGIEPPVCNEVLEIGLGGTGSNTDNEIYTDVGESCSLLKVDGQVEPYFAKAYEPFKEAEKQCKEQQQKPKPEPRKEKSAYMKRMLAQIERQSHGRNISRDDFDR